MAKKKYAGGGYVGAAGTNQGSWSGAGGSLGVRTGTTTGTSASNRPVGGGTKSAPGQIKKAAPKSAAKRAGAAGPKSQYSGYGSTGDYGARQGLEGAKAGTNTGSANPEGKGDREMRRGGIVKKKMSAEERKEFKGGKYMGGPAEEKAEKRGKKTFGKKMADGGTARYSRGTMGRPMERGSMPGVRMGQQGMMPGRRIGQTRQAPPTTATPVPMPNPIAGGSTPRPAPMPNPIAGGAAPRPAPMPNPIIGGSTPRMDGGSAGGISSSNLGGGVASTSLQPASSDYWTADRMAQAKPMRGGGLARKGSGAALAKGGLVKGAGCAQRGVKKPRMK